jgi:hypothetical protein
MRAKVYRREMMLLIFTARLTRQFDLYNPSQICNRLREVTLMVVLASMKLSVAKHSVAKDAFAKDSIAKDLGKRWRFFETYPDLQTSPVLRQMFPRTRDSEC